MLDPKEGSIWESGENGHATGMINADTLFLFYQVRSGQEALDILSNNWRYGLALFDINDLI